MTSESKRDSTYIVNVRRTILLLELSRYDDVIPVYRFPETRRQGQRSPGGQPSIAVRLGGVVSSDGHRSHARVALKDYGRPHDLKGLLSSGHTLLGTFTTTGIRCLKSRLAVCGNRCGDVLEVLEHNILNVL